MHSLIIDTVNRVDYHHNSYFLALANQTFDKNDFIETQIQFLFAVTFFSRPMAAIAAKIPDATMRLELIRNIWEEHGEGDLLSAHGSTFIAFLKLLGVTDSDEIARRSLWSATRQFNTTLAGATVFDEYLVGIAVMGSIELMFASISSWIGQGVIDNGWLTKEQLVHYNLHEKLDIKHAQDFFDVLTPFFEKGDVDDLYMIEQGIWLGAHCFNQFYENLYQERQQRYFRSSRCNHTRA